MRILFIGDIVGKPGRDAVFHLLKKVKDEEKVDAAVANGENAAGGSGPTESVAQEFFVNGVDIITSGDHIWKKKEIYPFLDRTKRLIRPLNYPEGAPGKGYTVLELPSGKKIAVINLIGRVFMEAVDCPFRAAEKAIAEIKKQTNVIVVDFHAEATSEKIAMGWFLDGRVSAVVGTHTHVQTADEHILAKGTAYITDCGMTGPFDSVIGRDKDIIIERFITQLPLRFDVAEKDLQMHGVIIDVDEKTGEASGIKRVQQKYK